MNCTTHLAMTVLLFVAGHPYLTLAGDPDDMILIPSGTFEQGLNSQAERNVFARPNQDHMKADRLPLRNVTLGAFWMGRYEVTNAEFADVLNVALKSGWLDVRDEKVVSLVGRSQVLLDIGNRFCEITHTNETFSVNAKRQTHPVVAVTWYGATFYCWARNKIEGRSQTIDLENWSIGLENWSINLESGPIDLEKVFIGDSHSGYRLPTEAEWEYAARGGLKDAWFPWGNHIEHHHANFFQSGDAFDDPFGLTDSKGTTPVGYFNGVSNGIDMANGYGLYDMAGNVQEWCADWYAVDTYGVKATKPINFKSRYKLVSTAKKGPPVVNPLGPTDGEARVVRGGSWRTEKTGVGCSIRYADYPETADRATGFRIVLSHGDAK